MMPSSSVTRNETVAAGERVGLISVWCDERAHVQCCGARRYCVRASKQASKQASTHTSNVLASAHLFALNAA
jgi:hypothetical protein